MVTYNELKKMFETCRNKDAGKPIARNTRLYRRGDNFAIRLHQTDIVTLTPQNTYVLHTGGWYTKTTKERINRYTPAHVGSIKGIWSLVDGKYNPVTLFYEGIKVDKRGKVISKLVSPDKKVKELKKLKLKIKGYVDAFCKHIEAGKLELPGPGDCWYCLGRVTDAVTKQTSESTLHLTNHIDENYFVPSLLLNALRLAGYSDPDTLFYSIQSGHTIDSASRALTKYFLKNLRKE